MYTEAYLIVYQSVDKCVGLWVYVYRVEVRMQYMYIQHMYSCRIGIALGIIADSTSVPNTYRGEYTTSMYIYIYTYMHILFRESI